MAYLPPEAITLSGGCHCRSVRYTINVPALEDRQLLPGSVDTRVFLHDGANGHDNTRVPTRIPVISLDHCGDCRHSVGSIVQSWFICPVDWVDWTLTPQPPSSRHDNDKEESSQEKDQQGATSGIKQSTLQVCALRSAETEPEEDLPASYVTRYMSSPDVSRVFCKHCGTHLTYFASNRSGYNLPPIVDVAVGSLDDESLSRVQPERHLWWDYGIDWVERMLWNGKKLSKHKDGNIQQEIRD